MPVKTTAKDGYEIRDAILAELKAEYVKHRQSRSENYDYRAGKADGLIRAIQIACNQIIVKVEE